MVHIVNDKEMRMGGESGIDWDAVERLTGTKHPRAYPSGQCVICGRTINESAYSGRGGNMKRHLRSCERKQKAQPRGQQKSAGAGDRACQQLSR